MQAPRQEIDRAIKSAPDITIFSYFDKDTDELGWSLRAGCQAVVQDCLPVEIRNRQRTSQMHRAQQDGSGIKSKPSHDAQEASSTAVEDCSEPLQIPRLEVRRRCFQTSGRSHPRILNLELKGLPAVEVSDVVACCRRSVGSFHPSLFRRPTDGSDSMDSNFCTGAHSRCERSNSEQLANSEKLV